MIIFYYKEVNWIIEMIIFYFYEHQVRKRLRLNGRKMV